MDKLRPFYFKLEGIFEMGLLSFFKRAFLNIKNNNKQAPINPTLYQDTREKFTKNELYQLELLTKTGATAPENKKEEYNKPQEMEEPINDFKFNQLMDLIDENINRKIGKFISNSLTRIINEYGKDYVIKAIEENNDIFNDLEKAIQDSDAQLASASLSLIARFISKYDDFAPVVIEDMLETAYQATYFYNEFYM